MLINEASQLANLTKKAVEYYTLQGLVSPAVSDNGYRNYSDSDVEALRKIGLLRKLEVEISEIRAILRDATGEALQRALIKRELNLQQSERKKDLLQKISKSSDFSEITGELEVLEKSKSIAERLLNAFPGYYGRYVSLHFSRFLTEPIQTEDQNQAYRKIIAFLDDMPPLDIPKDLEDYLNEAASHIGPGEILQMMDCFEESIKKPEEFLSANRQQLRQYWEYKQSDEYLTSPACRLMELMKQFSSASGYYDVFLPAMRELSSSYRTYSQQLDAANEKFLEIFSPEVR